MTRHKLDQVLKDKLEQLSVIPSQRANDKFESLLNKKGTPIWWYVAASVSLVITLSWWYWSKQDSVEMTPVIAAEPSELKTEAITSGNSDELEVADMRIDKSPKNEVADIPSQNYVETLSVVEEQEEDDTLKVRTTELTDVYVAVLNAELPSDSSSILENNVQIVSAEVEEIINEDISGDTLNNQPIPLPVVRITFKSGKKKKTLLAESKVPSDSSQVKNGALNAILNSAKNLANGSLIADLRDAKENFFNRNDD